MVDIATSLIAAIMSAYQLISSAPPTNNEKPHCHTPAVVDENVTTRCYYSADYSELSDEIRTSAGKFLMMGPWASEDDTRDPVIFAAVGDASVVANVQTRGIGFVTSGPGIMFNVSVDMKRPDAAVEIKGKSFHIDTVKFIDSPRGEK